VVSESHVESHSFGSGHSESSGKGASSTQTELREPDSGLFFPEVLGVTVGEGQFLSFASSESSFETSSSADGRTTTQVPITDHEEFKELSNLAYYTPEGLKQKFIGWLVNQNPRHAQLKIGNKAPMAIVTPWIEDVIVREVDVEKSKERIFLTCTSPVIEVDKQLKERQQLLLGKPSSQPVDFSKANIEDAEFVEVKKEKKEKLKAKPKPKSDVIDKDEFWA
jgi:hypothetical protein